MILSHMQIEEIAAAVTKDFNEFFFGKDADIGRTTARATPIDQFAKDYLGLSVSFANLSSDGSLCGLTAYADTEYTIEEEGVKRTIPLKANQVLLDMSFIQPGQVHALCGKRRFTLAHECAHQILFGMESDNDRRMDARRNFNPEEPKVMNGDILFADYMEQWLDIIKSSVAVPTFASYSTTVKRVVAPYFREKEITLKNLTAKDIQEFYMKELQRVSASSVIHYHANIHKALKYAVKIDLIDVNPADKVERPKKDRYVGSFYDADEVNALFEAAKGTKLELPILFGAFYGLRRSEAIGLKWDAIDFEQNTITIRHTVTSCDLDGKRVLVASDTTKTKSSMRTLPLVPFMRERLLALKEEQQENRRLCGRSYIKDYIGYVCVNEIGDLIKPHYVTESFPKLLKANGLRHIRYHDLRHSCASLLLANGVPMKQIQEWLGHSDFSTTANIYAHLDYSSKLTSADAMLNGLGLAPN